MLPSSCEFRNDQLRPWRIFVITLNKIKFNRAQRKVRNAESKQHLFNACMSWQKAKVLQYYVRMALSIKCKPHNSKEEHSAVWYHSGFLLFMSHINVTAIYPILTAELTKMNFSFFFFCSPSVPSVTLLSSHFSKQRTGFLKTFYIVQIRNRKYTQNRYYCKTGNFFPSLRTRSWRKRLRSKQT